MGDNNPFYTRGEFWYLVGGLVSYGLSKYTHN